MEQPDGRARLVRVRQITAHYDLLQGLRLLPVGGFLVAFALAYSGWWPHWELDAHPAPAVAAGGTALLLNYGLAAWYRRRFGTVTCRPRSTRWHLLYAGALGVFALAMVAEHRFAPPVSVFGLTAAALTLLYWWVLGAFQTHYLVLAALLAALSLGPVPALAGALFPASGSPRVTAVAALLGLLYCVGGLYDHRLLVRALGPPPRGPGAAGEGRRGGAGRVGAV